MPEAVSNIITTVPEPMIPFVVAFIIAFFVVFKSHAKAIDALQRQNDKTVDAIKESYKSSLEILTKHYSSLNSTASNSN